MARLCCSLLLLLPGPAVAQKEADPTSAAAAAAVKPHIVFCLTDDLGWNTMYNNPDIVSPHVNALAAGGVTLTSHYVYRYCSPTRAAFLVGRSPFHLLNIRENLLPAQIPQATDPRFTMLPKRLHDAGCTAMGHPRAPALLARGACLHAPLLLTRRGAMVALLLPWPV